MGGKRSDGVQVCLTAAALSRPPRFPCTPLCTCKRRQDAGPRSPVATFPDARIDTARSAKGPEELTMAELTSPRCAFSWPWLCPSTSSETPVASPPRRPLCATLPLPLPRTRPRSGLTHPHRKQPGTSCRRRAVGGRHDRRGLRVLCGDKHAPAISASVGGRRCGSSGWSALIRRFWIHSSCAVLACRGAADRSLSAQPVR